MGQADGQRNALTASELIHLKNRIQTEERLTCLYTQGAVECAQPQLRSFFAHQAEQNGERLEDLTRLLQAYSGYGR
jgi:hypothetical protein